jgi:sulfur relay (sulfurtransferase) complex TusBCD TusD component (DsrE family)
MGSIGQYPGVKDYIYNAWIENVTMLNAQVSCCFVILKRRGI